MGGQQSRTRKITLENEDPGNVIKVSDEVVERLRGSKAVRNVVSGVPKQQPHTEGFEAGVQPFFYEPSLTSLQIRQANLEEMKKNDEYWQRRIAELKDYHCQIQEIMDCEYKKAIHEVNGQKQETSNKLKTPPCLDNRAAVLACYKKYPNEPMRCAREVAAFTQCVDSTRATVVETRS